MKKKILFIALAVVLALSLGIVGCTTPAEEEEEEEEPEPIVLTLVLPQFSGDPTLMAVQPLIDRITEESEGELTFEIVGGPEAIAIQDQFDAVRTGVVDAGIGFGLEQGLIFGANLGFLEQNKPWVERESGWFDYKVEKYKEHNVKLVGKTIHSVWSQIYLNVPVERPQDIHELGLQIRCTSSFVPLLTGLGCSPVSLSISEIYSALERGVVDGFTYSGIGIVDNGWHEVCEYILEPKMYNSSQQLWINLDVWNDLPKHLQDLIDESIQWLELYYDDDFTELLESERAKMQEYGMTLITFSPADTEWYLELAHNAAWETQLGNLNEPEDADKIADWLTKE